jgi:hypothetical protein
MGEPLRRMKIYTSFEPVPSRMLAVARLLLAEGPMPEDELIPLLQPRENTGMAAATLSAAIECGLVVRERTKCMLAADLFEGKAKPSELDGLLPVILARLLLAANIESEANNFATLCAWLLHQPLLAMPVDQVGLKNAIQAQGLSLNDLQLQSNARLDNVIYWARYLGLVRQMSDEKCARVVPDPTLFLHRHLSRLLPAGEEVDVNKFRKRLGAICPVLDGGTVRDKLLERIAPDWPESQISESLSFAISRLERSGEVRAWCPDDQRVFAVTPPPAVRKIAYLARTK